MYDTHGEEGVNVAEAFENMSPGIIIFNVHTVFVGLMGN